MGKFYFSFFTCLCSFKLDLENEWKEIPVFIFFFFFFHAKSLEHSPYRVYRELVWTGLKSSKDGANTWKSKQDAPEWTFNQVDSNLKQPVYYVLLLFKLSCLCYQTRATSNNTLHVMCICSMQLLVFWSSSAPFTRLSSLKYLLRVLVRMHSRSKVSS